jgi:hypothetical protein
MPPIQPEPDALPDINHKDPFPTVDRAALQRKQAVLEQWLADNTTIKGFRVGDDGRTTYMSHEYSEAAEEIRTSGHTNLLAIVSSLNDLLHL